MVRFIASYRSSQLHLSVRCVSPKSKLPNKCKNLLKFVSLQVPRWEPRVGDFHDESRLKPLRECKWHEKCLHRFSKWLQESGARGTVRGSSLSIRQTLETSGKRCWADFFFFSRDWIKTFPLTGIWLTSVYSSVKYQKLKILRMLNPFFQALFLFESLTFKRSCISKSAIYTQPIYVYMLLSFLITIGPYKSA